MYGEQGFQIRDLTHMLRRRAGLVAALAGAVVLMAIFVAAILPNEYEAAATLLIEPQTIATDLVEPAVVEEDLNSRLHLIQMQILSRSRLSRVIDDLGLYAEESKQMTREEVIDMMRSQIQVEPLLSELEAQVQVRNREIQINTFQLVFRHHSPKMAAEVANRLARDFIDEHIRGRVEVSGDTSDFIGSELQRLTQRIQSVEERIAEVKENNVGRLPEDHTANQRLLERTLEGIRSSERELAQARSDESFFRQQALVAGPDTGPGAVTPAQRLETLKLELADYESRGYTEKHPDVISTKAEIESIRTRLENGEVKDGEPMSYAQQNARAEAERASLRARSAEAELDRMRKQAADLEERIAATPVVAEKLAALEREQEHLAGKYQEFSDKLQSATVAAQMERGQKGEQFKVLERAYPPTGPASPNRPLIVALGMFLGLGLGAAAALVLEASDRTLRGPRSVRPALGLPLLAAIPQIVLESDRVARRRRRVRRAAFAAAAVGLVLLAAVAGNWAVNGMPGGVKALLGIQAAESETASG